MDAAAFLPLAGLPRPICRSYREVERDAALLAERLVRSLDRTGPGDCSFVAIPRGGFFVLGMLAYLLNLEHSQLAGPGKARTLVIVDDCAYTGARFGQYLRATQHQDVIFAHLYSHPNLRKAVTARERNVRACVAAVDLHDHLPAVLSDAARRRRWVAQRQKRLPSPVYWTGLTEAVVLPWCEPELTAWDPVAKEMTSGWRLASPDRTLSTRAYLGLPPRLDGIPTYRIPDAVAFRLAADEVLLCHLDTGECLALRGSGADAWRVLAAYGDPTLAVAYLAERYDAPVTQLQVDVEALCAELLTRNLLESGLR